MLRNENINGVINQVKHINESSEKERGYKDECSLTLISNNNKYLLFLRSKNNSTYQNKYGLIGGGIEKGESPLEAMKRECSEEISFVPNNLEYITKYIYDDTLIYLYHFDLPDLSYIKLNNEHDNYKLFTYDEIDSTPNVIKTTLMFIDDYENLKNIKTEKMTLNEIKNLIKEIIKEEKNKKTKIDKKYTHFAISKKDNKIVTGWEYKNLDKESIIEYTKLDLMDMFPNNKYSDFKIQSKNLLLNKGFDPFDSDNWINFTY